MAVPETGLSHCRRVAALIIGALGVLFYNWWVAALFVPGLMHSANGFFSDLEASGLRDSSTFQHADIAAGICWSLALLFRSRNGTDGEARREWPWRIAFSACGILGGIFVYACPEGTSSVCRSLEWHFKLPLHHYIHMLAGIAEFATLTIALAFLARRRADRPDLTSRVSRVLFIALLAMYPYLGPRLSHRSTWRNRRTDLLRPLQCGHRARTLRVRRAPNLGPPKSKHTRRLQGDQCESTLTE